MLSLHPHGPEASSPCPSPRKVVFSCAAGPRDPTCPVLSAPPASKPSWAHPIWAGFPLRPLCSIPSRWPSWPTHLERIEKEGRAVHLIPNSLRCPGATCPGSQSLPSAVYGPSAPPIAWPLLPSTGPRRSLVPISERRENAGCDLAQVWAWAASSFALLRAAQEGE